MKKDKSPETFKLDNWLIQNAPMTYGAKNTGIQLHLPGLEPFGPFDYWSTMAIYSMIDPVNPTAAIETTPTELLERLEFARNVSEALAGHSTFPSEHYDLLNDSLQRLFTVEVSWRNYWKVYNKDQKTGRRTRGRPQKQWVEYHGRILQSYQYTYPPGFTPPEALPRNQREDVNQARKTTGERGDPILKRTDIRPSGIRIRLASDLVRGIGKEDPNIGATVIPLRIFNLRKTVGRYPKAVHLLVWVCRQTKKTMTRSLDRLAAELNVKGRNRNRNRESLIDYFNLLKSEGVVTSFEVIDKDNESFIRFTKANEWYFGKPTDAPALPDGDD